MGTKFLEFDLKQYLIYVSSSISSFNRVLGKNFHDRRPQKCKKTHSTGVEPKSFLSSDSCPIHNANPASATG